MMRFGLLALVSTAATVCYGQAVDNKNCPTIGVNLGIFRHSVRRNVSGQVDNYCLSQRYARDAFTSGTNREMSEFQFAVTYETNFPRYIWDMSNDDSVWIAGQPKFIVVADGGHPSLHGWHPDEFALPEFACQDGFPFDDRHHVRALVDNDVTLIVVPEDEKVDRSCRLEISTTQNSWPDNAEFPKIRVAAVTLRDAIFTTKFGHAPPAPYETRVMDAVKAVVYEDLKDSMSDKFPLCEGEYTIPDLPLCPSTQILKVEIDHERALEDNPSVTEDGIWRDGNCFRSFNEVTSWTPFITGWEIQQIRDWSLQRVVYDISTNWGDNLHFTENAQRAMVISIPRAASLPLAPTAAITETDLNNLTVPAAWCEGGFEYNWNHFVKGIWDDPKMVVILAAERDDHIDILHDVRDMINNEGVKRRIVISDALCGECLDELLTYYSTEIPLEFGDCRAGLVYYPDPPLFANRI